MSSYRVLWLCHCRLALRYGQLVAVEATAKRVHHLRTLAQVAGFLDSVGCEYERA